MRACGGIRQPGQTTTGEVARRDLRADLLLAEEEARNKKRKAEGKPLSALPAIAGTNGVGTGAEDEDAVKRRKLLQEALELDKDDDDEEEAGKNGENTRGGESEEESEDEDDDEDDTDELLRELEKIKHERAEEKEREQLASQAAQLGQSTGLNTTVPGTFAVKRRWDDGGRFSSLVA